MNLIESNAKRITHLVQEELIKCGKWRIIIAIVGAPGSGKSSIAERVIERLNTALPHQAALLPMDGFHYDDCVLETLGRREYKGAPDTFDVSGLQHMLQRLKNNNNDEVIAVPLFDRDLEISRAGACLISQKTRIILCEGNYLLLNVAPWNRLHALFDITIVLNVSRSELEKRLTFRWKSVGLSDEAIRFKVEKNDLPNGVMVLKESVPADIYLDN